jgi:UPF0716 protein FxsA
VRWLLLLFIIVPLVELYLMLVMGSFIGFWPTVGIILVTGVLGAALSKREGLRVWRSYREALAQGRLPDEGIVSGLLVLLGGALLITPGVLTDFIGFFLLLPFTRRIIAAKVQAAIAKKLGAGVMQVMTVGSPFVDARGFGDDGRPVDANGFPFARAGDDFFAGRGAYDEGDVVDTEGVEVQSALLLGEGDKPHDV